MQASNLQWGAIRSGSRLRCRLGQLKTNNHGSFGVRRLVAAMARASERKRRQVAALQIGTRYLSVFCAYPAAETDSHFFYEACRCQAPSVVTTLPSVYLRAWW